MSDEKKLVKCSIDGCGAEVEKEAALMPPLKILANHLRRRVQVDDLDKHAVCRACARAFVSAAEQEAKKSGRSIGQLFHPYLASVQLIQNLEHKREVEEEKRRVDEEERKRRAIGTLGALYGDTFARLRESAPDAEVLEHPTRKSGKGGKAAQRKRAGSKKAAG